MNRLALAAFMASILLVGGVACAEKGIDPQVVKLFGGADGVGALQTPDSVQAWRIGGDTITPKPGGDASGLMHGHPVLSGPVKVDAATAAKLGTLFRDAKSYSFDSAKGCEFSPGVLVRFTQGKLQVDVLICYGCNEIAIYQGEMRVGSEDIDSIHAPLVAAAKTLFPKDEVIQKLD